MANNGIINFCVAPIIEKNLTFSSFSSKKFEMVRAYVPVDEIWKGANSNFIFSDCKNVRVFIVRIRNDQREL